MRGLVALLEGLGVPLGVPEVLEAVVLVVGLEGVLEDDPGCVAYEGGFGILLG